jgi:hypothetical protein
MVLSTASQVGAVLQVSADPGSIQIINTKGAIGIVRHVRQLSFQVDHATSSKLDVFDGTTLLGKFPIAQIDTVTIEVKGLDSVNIDDSVGLPFHSGTNVSLFGSTSTLMGNSLNLSGSRVISGGETYTPGTSAQAASLALGGVNFQFTDAITAVSDAAKISGTFVVRASGQNVSQDGTDGVTQTLSGLTSAGPGSSITYSNKSIVNLQLLSGSASATLNATAAATGEQVFIVTPLAGNQGVTINATPSSVDTSVADASPGAAVFVEGNAGRVFVNGKAGTFVRVGGNQLFGTMAGIKNDVFVNGAGSLAVGDGGNTTKQERVTVTESTISGTGLFGKDTVTLHYSATTSLALFTGRLAATYTVVGSHRGARFNTSMHIEDNSSALSTAVFLDGGSGLSLSVFNQPPTATVPPASLFISAVGGKFNPSVPVTPTGTETVTFAGGLTSIVSYNGMNKVTHS